MNIVVRQCKTYNILMMSFDQRAMLYNSMKYLNAKIHLTLFSVA